MFLSIDSYSFKNKTSIFSTLYSLFYFLVLLFFLCFVPIFVWWNWRRLFKLKSYIGESYLDKYFAFFGEVKLTSRFSVMFYFFFFFWRLIYAASIVGIRKSMLGQCIVFLVTSVFMFLYLLIFRPYKSKLLNFVSLMNEALIVINSALFFLFWENPNPKVSFYTGWILIFLLIGTVVLNIFIMLLLKVIGLIMLMIKLC